MAIILTLNQSSVPFAVKLTDCDNDAVRDISNIAEQRIGFIKPDGTQFDQGATLVEDPENPLQVIAISNIVGNGVDGIIIVTISNTNLLKDGEFVSIVGVTTTDFDVSDVPLSIIDGTTFSYDLGAVGSATPDTGTATTQGEFLITFINVSPETTPLLDLVGMWSYFGKVKQTDSGVFATSQAVIFHVVPYNSSF